MCMDVGIVEMDDGLVAGESDTGVRWPVRALLVSSTPVHIHTGTHPSEMAGVQATKALPPCASTSCTRMSVSSRTCMDSRVGKDEAGGLDVVLEEDE